MLCETKKAIKAWQITQGWTEDVSLAKIAQQMQRSFYEEQMMPYNTDGCLTR